MERSLTVVLIRIFAMGFYKVHSGLLIFLFVTVFSYFFFINILNHVPPEELIFYNLILGLTFISAPAMVVLVFVVWLLYIIKSWNYVRAQLTLNSNKFLQYSSTSFSIARQFGSWFFVQLVISVPILVYALFSLLLGIIFHHYIVPVIIVFYVILLMMASAWVYVRDINRLYMGYQPSFLLSIGRNWKKPLFSLFLFHVLDRLKVMLIVTKCLSWLIISSYVYFFSEEGNDIRIVALIILGVILTHTVLVYASHQFSETALVFLRNFPHHRFRSFVNIGLLCGVFILPESIWLFSAFDVITAILLLLFGLTVAVLFRCVLYITHRMHYYLKIIFGVFILSFVIIMFQLLWFLVLLNVVASFLIFYNRYYQQQTIYYEE